MICNNSEKKHTPGWGPLVAGEAIQMHGGIGMTEEFDIGFYVKRGHANAVLYGDVHFHAERYAALNGY